MPAFAPPVLVCRNCGSEYPLGPMFEGCVRCSADAPGALEVKYDYEALRAAGILAGWRTGHRLWDFRPLLPLSPDHAPVSLVEGGTPLLRLETPGPGRIWIKDETRNPTGAHKDRFHSVSTSVSVMLGYSKICAATTGNHGLSLAAYAAKAGLRCLVFCDVQSPAVLRSAMQVFGAHVAVIKDRNRPLELLVRERGWCPSTGMTPAPVGTPYGVEGYKSIAYEIYLALGSRMPNRVLIPVAGGDVLYGPWKGFKELLLIGAEGDLPKMHAVQAAGCDPIVRGFRARAEKVPVHPKPDTIAISIADDTAAPVTLATLYESKGSAEAVTDEEIVAAMKILARKGILVEPAGAASLAGALQMQSRGEIQADEDVVCLATGGGLKWPDHLVQAESSHSIADDDPKAILAWIEAFDTDNPS